MASTILKTLYGRHDEITVRKEAGFMSLNYVVYRGDSRYSTHSALRDAVEQAEKLAQR